MSFRPIHVEPLIGALVGTIVVGYFTSTTPDVLASLILGAVFLGLSVQLLLSTRNYARSSDQVDAASARRLKNVTILSWILLPVSITEIAFSAILLVAHHHLFSIFGILCGACFATVSLGGIGRGRTQQNGNTRTAAH